MTTDHKTPASATTPTLGTLLRTIKNNLENGKFNENSDCIADLEFYRDILKGQIGHQKFLKESAERVPLYSDYITSIQKLTEKQLQEDPILDLKLKYIAKLCTEIQDRIDPKVNTSLVNFFAAKRPKMDDDPQGKAHGQDLYHRMTNNNF